MSTIIKYREGVTFVYRRYDDIATEILRYGSTGEYKYNITDRESIIVQCFPQSWTREKVIMLMRYILKDCPLERDVKLAIHGESKCIAHARFTIEGNSVKIAKNDEGQEMIVIDP